MESGHWMMGKGRVLGEVRELMVELIMMEVGKWAVDSEIVAMGRVIG